MANDTTQAQQDTTTQAAGAPETSGEPQGAPEVTEASVNPVEGQQEPDDDTTAALRKARQEAADRRVAAREATEAAETAKAEAEALRTRLSAVQDQWIRERLRSSGVGFDAFKAAGYTGDAVLDDSGDIDPGKFAEAVTDTAKRFGRIASPSGIVPLAGTGDPRGNTGPNWASFLNPQ